MDGSNRGPVPSPGPGRGHRWPGVHQLSSPCHRQGGWQPAPRARHADRLPRHLRWALPLPGMETVGGRRPALRAAAELRHGYRRERQRSLHASLRVSPRGREGFFNHSFTAAIGRDGNRTGQHNASSRDLKIRRKKISPWENVVIQKHLAIKRLSQAVI